MNKLKALLVAVGTAAAASGYADVIQGVGTLTTGGSEVMGFAGDTATLLNFAASAGIALTVVSVIIAVGWKVYRFFRPAR